MAYQFDDSEKFRANMMLIFGLGFMSPSGIAFNSYIANGDIPSKINLFILLLFFVVGYLLVNYAYSIIYIKDLKDV